MVEDVQGKVTGAEFMDYVTPKAVIKIGDGGSVVLSYLKSCRRETISGVGTVDRRHRGERRPSRRRQGREDRIAIPARRMRPRGETSGVAATVLRSVDRARRSLPRAAAHALRRIAAGGGQRTRQADHCGASTLPGERQEINLGGTQLKGRFFDFASENVALAPGGLYAATFKSSQIVFRVDPQAKPGATPIVGRLLRME